MSLCSLVFPSAPAWPPSRDCSTTAEARSKASYEPRAMPTSYPQTVHSLCIPSWIGLLHGHDHVCVEVCQYRASGQEWSRGHRQWLSSHQLSTESSANQPDRQLTQCSCLLQATPWPLGELQQSSLPSRPFTLKTTRVASSPKV